MDFLKKFFPYSFKSLDGVGALVVSVLIYILAAILGGVVIALAALLTGWVPVLGGVIGVLLGLVGTVIDLYCLVGIVIRFLTYFKVIKD